jgi:hypothetical protein
MNFVFAVTEPDSERKGDHLNVALKDIVLSLQALFQVVHPFANTKFDPAQRGKIIKAATELQLAIQNLVQGVKNRNVAVAQFKVRAEERLLYFTQVLVGAVWNMQVAAEFVPSDVVEAEAREFGLIFKEIISCALGVSKQPLSDLICFSKMQCVQHLVLVNGKVIEIYHSELQQQMAESAFTIFKGTKGILLAAEKVKSDPQSPHRETMSKLGQLILFQINRLCELLRNPRLGEMYNLLDEATEFQVIQDSCSQLRSLVADFSAKDREHQVQELTIFDQIESFLRLVTQMHEYLQPQTFSCHSIIATAKLISEWLHLISSLLTLAMKQRVLNRSPLKH